LAAEFCGREVHASIVVTRQALAARRAPLRLVTVAFDQCRGCAARKPNVRPRFERIATLDCGPYDALRDELVISALRASPRDGRWRLLNRWLATRQVALPQDADAQNTALPRRKRRESRAAAGDRARRRRRRRAAESPVLDPPPIARPYRARRRSAHRPSIPS